MRWFILAIVCFVASPAFAGLNTSCMQWPDTGQPTAAADNSYNCLRFNPSFSTLNQIDVADTGDATKNVFTHSTFPQAPGGWGYETEPSTNAADYSIVANHLVIAITGIVNYAGLPTQFMTCRYSASLNPGIIGQTFGPGYYAEVRSAIDQVAAANAQTWNGAWMPTLTQLTGTAPQRAAEVDIFEFLASPNFAIHDWSLNGATVIYNDQNNPGLPSYPADTLTHTLATLVVPKQYNGGTTGLFKRYVDGVHDATNDVSFTDAGVASPAPSGGGHIGNYTPLNTQHDCSSVTGGIGQIHSVEAWRVWTR